MGNFAVVNFDNFLFKLFLANPCMIKSALVILRQAMGITVDKATFTFNSQKPYFFVTLETSF
jgi:hypothetical protein